MDKKHHKIFKRSLNHYTVLLTIILLLLMIIALIIKISFGDYNLNDFLDDFLNSLIGAIIPLLLFNIIYEYLMRKYQSEVISDAVAETLLLNKDTLSKFSVEERTNFIKNCTQSLIGDEEGEMLYSTLFSPYLSEKQTFRRNFKYHIFYTTYHKLSHPIQDEEFKVFDSEKYVWILEELSYNKSYFNLDEEYLVGFSYNEQKLESLFRNNRILFRENLTIGEKEINFIRSLSNEKLLQFIQEVIQFSVEINGMQSVITGVEHDENGFVIRLKHNANTISVSDCEYCRLKINFRMPQLRNKRKFVVIISEPTHTVDILFSNQIDNNTVTAVPFFDQDEIVSFLPNNLITVELPGWVLPTSGIVFVWEDTMNPLA